MHTAAQLKPQVRHPYLLDTMQGAHDTARMLDLAEHAAANIAHYAPSSSLPWHTLLDSTAVMTVLLYK